MHLPILRSAVLLALPALGAPSTAQTEFPYAAGTDSTGRAQARSNAEGRVLIESPEFPRGLWVQLLDESGQTLARLQVEYQGLPDSLVALRCVDPAGEMQETLLWSRQEGDPLRLTLRPRETSDLPEGLTPIDWHIDPGAESLEETRLEGWSGVIAFLRERWQGKTGRVAVRLDSSATFAVDLEDHLEIVGPLLAFMGQQAGAPPGESTQPNLPVFIKVKVYEGGLELLEGAIVFSISLLEDSNLEMEVRQTLGRPKGPVTWQEAASFKEIEAIRKKIHSLGGLENFTALQRLVLGFNQIVDVTPLARLTRLEYLDLRYSRMIADLTPLAHMTNLRWLDLSNNQIEDISPLVANTGLGEGDSVRLFGNRLSDKALNEQIPALKARGVSVGY